MTSSPAALADACGRPPLIVRLGRPDVAVFRTLRLEALEIAANAFAAVHEVEAALPDQAHAERLAGSQVWALRHGDGLLAMVGLIRESAPTERHKAWLWGLYVAPACRGRGFGRRLVLHALAEAPGGVEQVRLACVRSRGGPQAFFEGLGFAVYGVEPRSLKRAHRRLDELLMVKFLTRVTGPGGAKPD